MRSGGPGYDVEGLRGLAGRSLVQVLCSVLLAKATCVNSLNHRYAPAGRLLRGVWPSTMYNDHAL
jgi:hypothetical protein